jgi:hypothetical protein
MLSLKKTTHLRVDCQRKMIRITAYITLSMRLKPSLSKRLSIITTSSKVIYEKDISNSIWPYQRKDTCRPI